MSPSYNITKHFRLIYIFHVLNIFVIYCYSNKQNTKPQVNRLHNAQAVLTINIPRDKSEVFT